MAWGGLKRRFEAMKRRMLFLFVLLTLLSGLMVTFTNVAHAETRVSHISSSCINPSGTTTLQGTLGGANYTIQVPSNWNGTLVLYSHGYVFATSPLLNPAPDAGDPLTGAALLNQGYALAGSSYSQNGWALQQAFNDQVALLDFFTTTCGPPTRTIAWGHSLGGIITAGLIQLYPDRFAGALPMWVCLPAASGPGTRDSMVPLPLTSCWRGAHFPSSISLIPRVLSSRPKPSLPLRSRPLRVERASHWRRPCQIFPAGLTLPHLNPPARISRHRSRINSSGKTRLTSPSPSLPGPNSRLVPGATPPGTLVSTIAGNWNIQSTTAKSKPSTSKPD